MLNGVHRHPRQEEVAYGRAAAEVVQRWADTYGAKRLVVVTSASLGKHGGLAAQLAADVGPRVVGVFGGVRAHSPREDVIAAAELARDTACDLLVAVGGGSVIDATKVVQLCIGAGAWSTDALDALRATPSNVPHVSALPLPVRMVAVPTTLSAAEYTSFAGVTDTGRHAKEGYYHPLLAPRAVALDPRMTTATPSTLLCSTGIKAVDHAVEQLANLERSPFADALAEAGLSRIVRALRAHHQHPDDLDARLECQLGAWLAMSGASAGRGIGASHAIGHTLGGLLGVPHGITSAVVLPAVLAYNEPVLGDRGRLIASLMGEATASASEAVRRLCADLGLPTTLSAVGVDASRFREIAEHTMHDRGIRANPRPIRGPEDVEEILGLAR